MIRPAPVLVLCLGIAYAGSAEERVEVEDPKLKAEIEDCIHRGVAWLKARQEASGAWPALDPSPAYPGQQGAEDRYQPEMTALALLALLKCEVPAADPAIEKGFSWLKGKSCATGAYGYATMLMALEARAGAGKEALSSKPPKGKEKDVAAPRHPGADLQVAARWAQQILGLQDRSGGWRYGNVDPPLDMEGGKPGLADVSATQYALMGLQTARRLGVPVRAEVFRKAAEYLLDQQEAQGPRRRRVTEAGPEGSGEEDVDAYTGKDRARGFPYMKGHVETYSAQASGGMTCAGLVGLMICREAVLEEAKGKPSQAQAEFQARIEQGIWDALAWLDAHWSVRENPGSDGYELGYYLYALERVGIMGHLREIGPGHDWYEQGARLWTSRITPAGEGLGYWALGGCRPKAETQDTPYGLLFLRKAAVRLRYRIGEAQP